MTVVLTTVLIDIFTNRLCTYIYTAMTGRSLPI